MNKVQESLRRIQEEAKRRVAEANKPVEPVVEQAPVALDAVKDAISGAVVKALTANIARSYIGDLSEKIEEIARQTILNSKDTLGNLTPDANRRILVYPNNCKLVVRGEAGRGSMVIEEKPQLRTVFARRGSTVQVPMPYLIYIIGFYDRGHSVQPSGMGIGFRVKPLESVDDVLGMPALPHASGNTHICQPMNYASARSLTELAEQYVNVFWESRFVYDFKGHGFDMKDGRRIDSWAQWQKLRKNPLDILTAKFRDGASLRTVLTTLAQIEGRKDKGSASQQVQQVVNSLVNQVQSALSADELSKVITKAAKEIVASVESTLQPTD